MRQESSFKKHFGTVLVSVLLLAGLSLGANLRDLQAQEAKEPPAGEIVIEKIAPIKVLSRNLKGGYDRTQEAFSDLKGVMMRHEAKAGRSAAPAAAQASALAADCIGIYPFDPDAVQKSALTWDAAIMVPETAAFRRFKAPTSAAKLSVPASGYKLQTLPAIEAAVMYTTVGRSPQDGLKFFSWMAENGYVQVGATRMLYFADPSVDLLKATPEQIAATKAKIMVPIKKREREIALKKE